MLLCHYFSSLLKRPTLAQALINPGNFGPQLVYNIKFNGLSWPLLRLLGKMYVIAQQNLFSYTLPNMITKGFPTLTTDRLLLRQFSDSDLENVFRGLSHPHIIKYYGVSFNSIEATKEQMNWFADLEKNGTGIWWAVCSPDNSIFYGAGGLNGLQQEHKKAEIGFWLMQDYWGQGIMQEAMPLICNYGFDKLGLHRIEGIVETENQNCKRAMAKLDFSYEGTMKDCEVKNGKFISLDIYAMLNYENRKNK